MSLTEHPDLIQGSDEWLAERRGMVTASVVGKLITARLLAASDVNCPDCGAPAAEPCRSKVKRAGETGAPIKTAHPERTAFAVANRDTSPPVIEIATNTESAGLTAILVAERITGWTEPTYVTDDMLRGSLDEPRAAAKYAEYTGIPVKATGFMVRDDYGFNIGYSPDGLVGEDGLIEVKSRRPKKHLQTILSDEIPAENMAQIQCGLLVTGRKWCDYVSYCGGMPMWPKRVYPDPAWAEAIVAAVREFETTAKQMVGVYDASTIGLPSTERILDLEMSL